MALVPNKGNAGNRAGHQRTELFTQLPQENQQINVFIIDWTLERTAEEEAEVRHRHRMMMDVIYTEAIMRIMQVSGGACRRRRHQAI